LFIYLLNTIIRSSKCHPPPDKVRRGSVEERLARDHNQTETTTLRHGDSYQGAGAAPVDAPTYLDACLGSYGPLVPDAEPDGLSDLLAQQIRHPTGRCLGHHPPRHQKDDLLSPTRWYSRCPTAIVLQVPRAVH